MTVAELLLAHAPSRRRRVGGRGPTARAPRRASSTLEMREQLMARKYEILAFIRTAASPVAAPATTVVAVRSGGRGHRSCGARPQRRRVLLRAPCSLSRLRPAVPRAAAAGARCGAGPCRDDRGAGRPLRGELRAFLPGGPTCLAASASAVPWPSRPRASSGNRAKMSGCLCSWAARTRWHSEPATVRASSSNASAATAGLLWRSPAQHGRLSHPDAPRACEVGLGRGRPVESLFPERGAGDPRSDPRLIRPGHSTDASPRAAQRVSGRSPTTGRWTEGAVRGRLSTW